MMTDAEIQIHMYNQVFFNTATIMSRQLAKSLFTETWFNETVNYAVSSRVRRLLFNPVDFTVKSDEIKLALDNFSEV